MTDGRKSPHEIRASENGVGSRYWMIIVPMLMRALPCMAAGCLLASPAAVGQEVTSDATAPMLYSEEGADSCLLCHIAWTTVSEIFDTKHAVPTDPRGPFGPGQTQCESCHGPGGAHAGRVRRGEERPSVIRFAADSTSTVAERNERCLDCHDSQTGFGWHGGPHDDNQVACTDCHTIHASRDAVLSTTVQAEVCYNCHATVGNETLRAFAHPVRSGKMSCTSCHSPHGATLDLQLVRQTVNQTCFQCHAEKRGPFLWEHAPVAEDCTLCHAPHGSNHASMLVQRAPFLCQSCHSQAGHPSISQTPDGLAGPVPSAFLLRLSCTNCHSQVHGSNHPSGAKLMR